MNNPRDPLQVLLIEDSPGDGRLVQELLVESKTVGFELRREERLSAGLRQLSQKDYDVVLLDLGLPDSYGLETLLAVRKHKPDIAVIVLTGMEDEAIGLQATLAGAQDYLVKGQVSSQVLIRSIRYSIERKRFEKQLEHLATHDDLTGLPNRQLFNYNLGQALERAHRDQHDERASGKVAVMLLDLDDFKQVNDTFGHLLGDKLLCAVAGRLLTCVRKSDTVARMGGDEFTLVIENITGQTDSAAIAAKVLATLARPFSLDGADVQTAASIGISIYPVDGSNPDSLLKFADIAMYRAKMTGNCYEFYSPEKDLGWNS